MEKKWRKKVEGKEKNVNCMGNPGGHMYFRQDIILVKGLSKHTLNTYFSGCENRP